MRLKISFYDLSEKGLCLLGMKIRWSRYPHVISILVCNTLLNSHRKFTIIQNGMLDWLHPHMYCTWLCRKAHSTFYLRECCAERGKERHFWWILIVISYVLNVRTKWFETSIEYFVRVEYHRMKHVFGIGHKTLRAYFVDESITARQNEKIATNEKSIKTALFSKQ